MVIDYDKCTIYLNSSGIPLYKRGYKKNTHKAPLNECLASGLIYMSKWSGKKIFVDPMCGSGTLCFEAAMIKQNIPPGLNRSFSFQKWMNYDNDLFHFLRKKSIQSIKKVSINNVAGYDKDSLSVDGCRETKGDFKYTIEAKFENKNIRNIDLNKSAIVVTNPPYEMRIGSDIDIAEIHDGFKKILDSNSKLYVIYPIDSDFIEDNYKYKKILDIYNGPILCGFYEIKENV